MPIKFEIYRNGERLSAFEPIAVFAVGPESVPISGEVIFRDGLLVVNRKDEHATGVALMWDCGALGTIHLETTRLQSREKNYTLNVELARSRLMKIMQKHEDWSLFDFSKAEKFTTRFQEAQTIFAEALSHLDQPAIASQLADQALEIALELSEQLAAFHSDVLLTRRRSNNSFAKHLFGCRVDATVQNEKYREVVASSFDYAVVPVSWRQLQPQENSFVTEPLDEWLEMLSKRRVPTILGPLLRMDQASVPDWMALWEHDFDMIREATYEYVQRVVTRYRKVVGIWNVLSGLQTNNTFTLTFEQIIELTRLIVSQVKTIIPNARTLITIARPFGEYHARAKASVPPLMYAEMVAGSGINFEAFGLEIEMGVPVPGMFVRDLFQLSCLLDRFSTLGRPVFITAVGVPSRATPDPGDTSEGRLDPSTAGKWRRPWDPNLQAEWMEAVFSMALSKPFVESIAWSNVADLNQTLPGGGLLDDMLRPKPSFNRLQQMREKFRAVRKS